MRRESIHPLTWSAAVLAAVSLVLAIADAGDLWGAAAAVFSVATVVLLLIGGSPVRMTTRRLVGAVLGAALAGSSKPKHRR